MSSGPPGIGSRHVLLETYRADGTPVRTTVWFAQEGGSVYVVTRGRTGTARRVRADPRVRRAPCGPLGGSPGAWLEGTAEVLAAPEAARAVALRRGRYGPLARLAELASRGRGEIVAIRIELRPWRA